jgi:hypothetical protein
MDRVFEIEEECFFFWMLFDVHLGQGRFSHLARTQQSADGMDPKLLFYQL